MVSSALVAKETLSSRGPVKDCVPAALCYFTPWGVRNGRQIVCLVLDDELCFFHTTTPINEQMVDIHKQTCINSLTCDGSLSRGKK